MNKNCFSLAFKTSIPVLFGYLAIGIAFGLMVTDANYPWWLALFMSVFMYAGAGEYIAIGLFAAGTPLSAILITELLVNIRHIVYGLSLISKFKKCGKIKYYMIFALTDETYSLLSTTEVPQGLKSGEFYGLIAALDHFYWISGSVLGALIGKFIPFSLEGVDFALTALFTVLTIDQIEKSKDFFAPAVGAVTTFFTILLWKFNVIKTSSNILLVSIVIGLAFMTLVKRLEITKSNEISVKNEIHKNQDSSEK